MNEIEELEDILDAIIQAVQQALENGEDLPQELQEQVAQEITYLTQEIDQLYSQQQETQSELQEAEAEQAEVADEMTPQEPPPPSQNIPELNAAPHESSNINSFKYDPKSGQLYVKFQDKYPGTNGPTYLYEGVPPFIYNIFKKGAVAPKTSGSNAWHTWKQGVTPSHGAAMYKLIKNGGYNYRKLS